MTDDRAKDRWARRDFLRTAAGAVAAGGLAGLAGCEDPGNALAPASFAKGGGGGGKPKQPPTRNPLYTPPTASPSGLTLDVAPSVADLGDGTSRSVWAYNEFFPGPTLIQDSGKKVTVTLTNHLSQETITHWHGMIVDHLNDGHPSYAIAPGGSYDYAYTISQRACLNWYHPHPHMMTGEQVAMGLAGAFIVRDAEEAAPGLPSGGYEVPLIVRDASFDCAGNMAYTPKRGGFEGNTPLVNGSLNPYLAVDKTWYRFRILAGTNARIFRFALSNGAPFHLIGNDGGLIEATG